MSLEQQLREFAIGFEGRLRGCLIQDVLEYVQHGENGLALEVLCDWLGDSRISLTSGEHTRILQFAASVCMDTSDRRYEYLKQSVTA